MCHHDEGTVLVGGFAAAAVQVWVKHGPDPPSQLDFVSPLARIWERPRSEVAMRSSLALGFRIDRLECLEI